MNVTEPFSSILAAVMLVLSADRRKRGGRIGQGKRPHNARHATVKAGASQNRDTPSLAETA